MSTTFGVKIPLLDNKVIEEVAFRSSYMRWKNPLAQLLPDDLEVIPLDNNAQGIYTIGDIKKAIDDNYIPNKKDNRLKKALNKN